MLSQETLQRYRQMTPGERLRLTLDLSRAAWKALSQGPEELVKRRFLRLQQENDLRNQRICEGLRRAFPIDPASCSSSEAIDDEVS